VKAYTALPIMLCCTFCHCCCCCCCRCLHLCSAMNAGAAAGTAAVAVAVAALLLLLLSPQPTAAARQTFQVAPNNTSAAAAAAAPASQPQFDSVFTAAISMNETRRIREAFTAIASKGLSPELVRCVRLRQVQGMLLLGQAAVDLSSSDRLQRPVT
jgi:hypothetical protein